MSQPDPVTVTTIITYCTSTESYERRDKPSVLVTSPGSPDLHSTNRCSVGGSGNRYTNRLAPVTGSGSAPAYDPNVGGRIQVKLGFESSSLQLIVTLVCAAGLTQRSNGAPRNPYGKVGRLDPSGLVASLINYSSFADLFSARFGQVEAENKDIGKHK